MKLRLLMLATILCGTSPSTTLSQSSAFIGRVLTDSGVAIPGAEVVLNGPTNLQRTNERGEFRFVAVPAGFHVVGTRKPGFAPKIDTIEVADAGEVRRDPLCRALVWLDYMNVGTGFNVNELDPSAIAAVEWYGGPASIPARFAVLPKRGETYCGVLVIWLR